MQEGAQIQKGDSRYKYGSAFWSAVVFAGRMTRLTALYSLYSVKENKIRVVQPGIMKPLVELMADFGSNMVDKSAYVLSVLVSVSKARVDVGGGRSVQKGMERWLGAKRHGTTLMLLEARLVLSGVFFKK
ncbi:hypothetical protein ACFX1T_043560 [Malus domestica]